MMLAFEDMPEDNEDLTKIDIEFDHVSFALVSEPKEIEPYLNEYLEIEGLVPDNELHFLRTAQVKETVYWIWEFTSNGEKVYATAVQDQRGSIILGCNTDYYGLTPEQFILGDYHDCF